MSFLYTYSQILTPNLSSHSSELTLIHLRLTSLTAMQHKQSAQLIQPLLRHFPHEFISSQLQGDQTSPVHYVCPHTTNWNWKCYVPLWCTPNRLALSNQACEAITNQSYESRWIWKWGVGNVGVSDRVFILGVLASWELCSITGLLIIDIFFGVAFMSHGGWGNRALADQIRCSSLLALLEGSPPIRKTLHAKCEQPRWHPFPTV